MVFDCIDRLARDTDRFGQRGLGKALFTPQFFQCVQKLRHGLTTQRDDTKGEHRQRAISRAKGGEAAMMKSTMPIQ